MLAASKYFLGIIIVPDFFTKSALAQSEENPLVEISFDAVGCSDSSASDYNNFCHKKLHKGAMRLCIEKGYSGEVQELENFCDFDDEDGNQCSTTSGRYISFAFIANYRYL
jgi:hypothetical protein